MANLVAHRCERVRRSADRELLWFIQLLSHRSGLPAVASELIARYADRLATPAMQRYGAKSGNAYSADHVRAVRAEIPGGDETFLLRGELSAMESCTLCEVPTPTQDPLGHWTKDVVKRHADANGRASGRPDRYDCQVFLDACRQAAEANLEPTLAELCLNPGLSIDRMCPWYFPGLVPALREFKEAWVAERKKGLVVTQLGAQVWEEIEYASEGRCLTVVDGLARTGKTHAAKAWCELHPGRGRYIQVPSTNDDIGFFRAIAKAVGVSINLNSKAQELRQRIEEAIQPGDLVLVFDEAHYLWPNGNYRLALPGRLNWIMTALVNFEVPVCLITTPQFFKSQRAVEQRTHWTSEQFIGRIGHYQRLPDTLDKKDLSAVARALLPDGDSVAIEMLVLYAQGSAKYLAAIETAARRARFLATRDGAAAPTRNHVKAAIADGVIPSDTALARALSAASGQKHRRGAAVPSAELAPSHSRLGGRGGLAATAEPRGAAVESPRVAKSPPTLIEC